VVSGFVAILVTSSGCTALLTSLSVFQHGVSYCILQQA